MLDYPHWCKVTAPGAVAVVPGVGAGDGGGYGEPGPVAPATPPVPDVVLVDCAADYQDVGEVIPRNASGLPENRGDATVFLADERDVFELPIGATVLLTLNPDREPGETVRSLTGAVTYARVLDGALLCLFPEPGLRTPE